MICSTPIVHQLERQEVQIARHFLGPVRRSKSACLPNRGDGGWRVAIQLADSHVIRLRLVVKREQHPAVRFEDFTGWFRVIEQTHRGRRPVVVKVVTR